MEMLAKRKALFGESFSHDIASLKEPAKGLQHRWCIEGNWKLIVDQKESQRELYDLAGDPEERQNLAASQTDVPERLVKRLDAWWNGKQVAVAEDNAAPKKVGAP